MKRLMQEFRHEILIDLKLRILEKLGSLKVFPETIRLCKSTQLATQKANCDSFATKLRQINCKLFYRKTYAI